jgi:hypothetical protein
MDYVACDFCGKKFKRKRSQIKLAIKHYCSPACSGKGKRNGGISIFLEINTRIGLREKLYEKLYIEEFC